MRIATNTTPSWPIRLSLAAACFFGTVQAGPASDSASSTFQLPAKILVEVLPN